MTESQNRMNDVPETNVQRNHRILAQIISQINQCVNDNSIFRTEVDVLNTLGVRTKEGDQIKVCRTGLYKINGFKSIWFPNFIENREHWTNTLSSDNNEIIEWEYNNHPDNNWRERKNRLNSAQQYLEKYPQEEAPLESKTIYIVFGRFNNGFRYLGLYEVVECDIVDPPFKTIWKRINPSEWIQ